MQGLHQHHEETVVISQATLKVTVSFSCTCARICLRHKTLLSICRLLRPSVGPSSAKLPTIASRSSLRTGGWPSALLHSSLHRPSLSPFFQHFPRMSTSRHRRRSSCQCHKPHLQFATQDSSWRPTFWLDCSVFWLVIALSGLLAFPSLKRLPFCRSRRAALED